MIEITVDNFAGGGGASFGIEAALGRPIDIAINHDAEAIAMHAANHPQTRHYTGDIWDVDPREAVNGRPVGLAWFSPDCKHFSKAKGGKPVEKRIRGLAWVVVRWAKAVRPRVIMLENVEEFADWGPLGLDGKPCPLRKGMTFRRWCKQLQNLGYELDMRELRACDYGAPTTRKRLFIIARCDGRPIVWPEPTHGHGLLPYRTAAECIEWSIPCPSIFERKRPLKDATLRRIARGIMKYVVNNPKPFIVPATHGGDARAHSIDEPLRTVTGAHRGEQALVAPHVTRFNQNGVGNEMTESLDTVTAGAARFGLVTPQIIGIDNRANGERDSWPADDPLRTITAENRFALVAPHLTKFRQNSTGSALDEPMHTITAGGDMARPAGAAHAMGIIAPTLVQTSWGERPGQAPRALDLQKPLGTIVGGGIKHALVAAFMAKHYGGHETPGSDVRDPLSTVTEKDHNHLVMAHVQRDMGRSVGHEAAQPLGTVTAGGGGKAGLVTSHVVKLRGDNTGHAADQPLQTLSAGGWHFGEVRAFLSKYYGTRAIGSSLHDPIGTVTPKDRFGLVTVAGQQYAIADIGMRMLVPRELFRAQGFPDSYVIDPIVNGKALTKTAQVRMVGNSVCPPIAEALVRANLVERREERAA